MDKNDIVQLFSLKDIHIDEEKANKFLIYKNLIQEYNKFMDLTAVDDDIGIINRHFLDSLSILKYTDFIDFKKIIDVGTGAGFPAIPLAIYFNNIEFVAVDSLNKRIEFLKVVLEKANIKNVKVIHSRAEDLARDIKYREKFDACVSRAVASLNILAEYSLPFLKNGGKMISLKSNNISEELLNAEKAFKLLNSKVVNVIDYIDACDIDRKIVIIEKFDKIDKKYPRKAGIAKKMPL